MDIPKSFQPKKKSDKNLERLIEKPRILNYEDYEKRIDLLDKLNLDEGVLFQGVRPAEFKESNLPYEKIVYAGIACAKLGESFYRYRFNYKAESLNSGLRWLEVVDTKFPREEHEFRKLIGQVENYHGRLPFQSNKRKINIYELRLNKPQSKKDLIDAVEKFYASKFAYLGAKYNMFFTKIIYKGLTEEEFLNSNIALHHVDPNFNKYPRLPKNR